MRFHLLCRTRSVPFRDLSDYPSVMPIEVNLGVLLAKRKVSLNDLSEKVGITIQNLSILKTGRAKAIRFSTLEKLCEVLKCQPGELLEFAENTDKETENESV